MRWLLVDRLLECVPGKNAVAIKNFSRTDPFFEDHFPGNPIVPGVLLVEIVAKTARMCVQVAEPATYALVGVIKSAKFHLAVTPGDQCRIQVEITSRTHDYFVARGVVSVDGKKVAEAEILSVIRPALDPSAIDPVIIEWKNRLAKGSTPPS